MSDPEFNANRERGFYAPFPIPFHVEDEPAHQPDEEPLVWLCFNEDYLPYVQGALKALASELTFEGPRSCVSSWVQSMMNLLLKDPCSCGGIPDVPSLDWQMSVEYLNAAYLWNDNDTYGSFAGPGDSWAYNSFNEFTREVPEVSIQVTITNQFREIPRADCKGPFFHFRVYGDFPMNLGFYTVWIDHEHFSSGTFGTGDDLAAIENEFWKIEITADCDALVIDTYNDYSGVPFEV